MLTIVPNLKEVLEEWKSLVVATHSVRSSMKRTAVHIFTACALCSNIRNIAKQVPLEGTRRVVSNDPQIRARRPQGQVRRCERRGIWSKLCGWFLSVTEILCTVFPFEYIRERDGDNMRGPRGYCVWWNAASERQILYDCTYMWRLNSKWASKIKQNQSHRCRCLPEGSAVRKWKSQVRESKMCEILVMKQVSLGNTFTVWGI